VADYLDSSTDSYQWNVIFIRDAHDWEVDVFALFINFLYSFRLRQGGEDKFRRDHSKREMFDVRSFYNVLVSYDNTPFPGKVFGSIRPL
jgi:hypothetical protein